MLLTALRTRYATKKFDPARKISEADWKTLESSLVLAPSSYGLEPWKFHVIENPAIREKLRAASWNQTQVTDASHYVVFTFKKSVKESDVAELLERTSATRGVPIEALDGYRKVITGDLIHGPRSAVIAPWAGRQTYIALGFAMLSAAILGIDTCPMEGIDPAEYDRILGLEGSEYATVAGLALGYRHAEDRYADAKKVRKHVDQVIVHHR